MSEVPRIGPMDAEVAVFNKGGRDFRLDRIERGEETPREFFYGFLDLAPAGVSAAMLSTSGAVPGLGGAISHQVEEFIAYMTSVGFRPWSARMRMREGAPAKVMVSYTDGFSLSLGLANAMRREKAVVIGGFHGLSDIAPRAPQRMRGLVECGIRKALSGLDHAFFFGAVDRQVAIERYGLSADKSSVIPFGVDTDFWRPLPDESLQDFVVAVGQDPNRDYDLLANAPGEHPTRIVTRRKIAIPPGATHIKTTVGDFFGSDSMSDEDLRRLYNAARAVIIPVKDVFQPSGYSVSLQAMACGRPTIISAIKGLWYPDILKDGENCLLVPPGDGAALGEAIGRVRHDAEFARRIGENARRTAVAHLGLDRIGGGTVAIARLGLEMAKARGL